VQLRADRFELCGNPIAIAAHLEARDDQCAREMRAPCPSLARVRIGERA